MSIQLFDACKLLLVLSMETAKEYRSHSKIKILTRLVVHSALDQIIPDVLLCLGLPSKRIVCKRIPLAKLLFIVLNNLVDSALVAIGVDVHHLYLISIDREHVSNLLIRFRYLFNPVFT